MIFVDTWAWIALSSRRDQYHKDAVAIHRQMLGKRRYVTTHFVLNEVITYLYPVIGPKAASIYVNSILQGAGRGLSDVLPITPARFNAAWELRQKYADKPDISFTDLTSMAVMQELGIVDIFTGDVHFEHVNMGFRLLPEHTG